MKRLEFLKKILILGTIGAFLPAIVMKSSKELPRIAHFEHTSADGITYRYSVIYRLDDNGHLIQEYYTCDLQNNIAKTNKLSRNELVAKLTRKS